MSISLSIIIIGTALVTVFFLNMLISLLRDKVPYVSSPAWVIETVANHQPIAPGAVVYDLGCGDGRTLRLLIKRFPGITAIGYERNWWPYLLARLRARGSPIEIRRGNFFKADLRNADTIFCFLIPSLMPRVEKLLQSQLKPGARVYSYAFSFPTWKPMQRIPNPRGKGSVLLVYQA